MKMIIFVYMKESRYIVIKLKKSIINNKKIIIMCLIVVFLILLDQLIKIVILNNLHGSSINLIKNFLNLTYVENTGGAFGVGSENIATIIIINIIIITVILRFIYKKRNEISYFVLVGLSLVLAGGISNLLDRIFRGFVIDYIDINLLFKYPMFNVADILIVFGCIIIALLAIIDTAKTN